MTNDQVARQTVTMLRLVRYRRHLRTGRSMPTPDVAGAAHYDPSPTPPTQPAQGYPIFANLDENE